MIIKHKPIYGRYSPRIWEISSNGMCNIAQRDCRLQVRAILSLSEGIFSNKGLYFIHYMTKNKEMV